MILCIIIRIHYYIIHCICYYIQEECPMKMISKELTFVCIAKATFGEFQVHLDDEGTYILYVLSREIIDETPSNQFFVYVLYFLIWILSWFTYLFNLSSRYCIHPSIQLMRCHHLSFIIRLAVSKILIHICHVKVPVLVFLLLGW